MSRSLRGSMALVCLISVAGCRERLVHEITCDKIATLRLGMAETEVRNLLGPADFEHESGTLNGEPDIEWIYATDRAVTFPFGGYDWFDVHFRAGKLVVAEAYQKGALAVRFDSEPTAAFHLNYRDDGHGDQTGIRREFGPAFESVFPCPPGVRWEEVAER